MAFMNLGMPCASTTSERAFSIMGQIYVKRRSRLDPHKAGMLLFLKQNKVKLLGKRKKK